MGNTTSKSYGPRGETRSVTDPLGKTATYNYDVFQRPTDSKVPKDQAAGRYVVYPAPVYDGNDNVTTSTAANSAVTTAIYDADDRLASTTLPPDGTGSVPRVMSYTYDPIGNRLSYTEPNGNVSGATQGSYTTKFGYDDANELTTVTNALNKKTVIGYDNAGNKVSVTDPLTHVTGTDYDLDHRPTVSTDAFRYTTRVGYDKDGLTVSRTDQNGTTVNYTLDANGQVTQVEVPHTTSGTTTLSNYTQYTYDQVGNNTGMRYPKGLTTGGGFETTISYDKDNRRTQELGAYDPAKPDDDVYGANYRPETNYTYDAASRIATQTWVAKAPGRKQTSATSTFSYFDNGWVKQSVDPFQITTDYEYNDLGQQASRKLTAADGSAARTMTWTYFPDGKLSASSDTGLPVGWQSQVFAADSGNNNFSPGDWTAAGTGYDGSTYYQNNGLVSSFVWNLSVPQTGDYKIYVWYPAVENSSHNASYSVDGGNPVVIDQSKNSGTWVQITNPANNGQWHLTNDNKQYVVLNPDGGTTAAGAIRIVRDNSTDTQVQPVSMSYTYDTTGNRTGITDSSSTSTTTTNPTPIARFTSYTATFDQLNRPRQFLEKDPAGAVAHTLTYDYDDAGNLTSQTNDNASSTYWYDPRNMLSQVLNKTDSTDPGITTSYDYTKTGQRNEQIKGNDNNVRYTYYLDGTLHTSAETDTAGTVVNSHELSYDDNNNVTQDKMSLQKGDSSLSTFDRTVTRTYSPNNQVTDVSSSDGQNTENYVYDTAGDIIHQVAKKAQVDFTVDFTYDRGRVQTATPTGGGATASYAYDTVGRLRAVTNGVYPGGDSQQYEYDGYDNLTSQSQLTGTPQSTTTNTYDTLNRPITSAVSSGGTQIDSETLNYLGTTRTVTDEQVNGGGGSDFKTYDYASNGERLAVRDTATSTGAPHSQTSYYTYNQRQDVEALTDATGTSVASYGYTAYGSPDTTLNSGIDQGSETRAGIPYNVYRFNSARITAGTGNLDMGFRTYNPGFNQFLNRDSYNGAGADTGLAGSRYGFAGGNPVSNIELDGHNWQTTVGVTVGVLAVAGLIACTVVTEGGCLAVVMSAAAEGATFGGEGMVGAAAFTSIIEGASAIASTVGVEGAVVGTLEAGGAAAGLVAVEESAGADLGAAEAGASRLGAAEAGGAARGAAAERPSTSVSCGGESFRADTKVELADGSTKPISEMKPGDRVRSTDTASGRTKGSTTSAVMVNHDTDLYDLKVRTAKGRQVIHTTAHHLFYDRTTHSWVQAVKLHPGDRLTSDDGSVVTVESGTTPAVHAGDMWDLTVPGDHDFYVLAGNTPVLVHNDDGIYSWPNTDGPIPQRGQTALYAQFGQRTGEFLKWGVWTNTTGNYSRYTQKYLRERGIQTTVLRNFDSKAEAHAVERALIARAPGPHNLEQRW